MAKQYKKSKDDSAKDRSILEVALDRFKLAEEAFSEIRKLGLEDLKFLAGEQWHQEDMTNRRLENRPCLTINRMPQFVRQITNEQRQNSPSIKVNPVDDRADVETAKILQGMIRHIEYNSNADNAYDGASEGAAIKGFGYFRIVTDYVDPVSFDQEILIKKIHDDFSVFLDPSSKEPDGSDANWGFIFEDLLEDEYKRQYPNSELSSMEQWESLGNKAPNWINGKSCRIAEYFYKDYEKKKVHLLSSGEVILDDDLSIGLPENLQIIKTKMADIPVIKWCKINGIEILEKTDWLGSWIPIIPVYGNMLFIDGKLVLEGVVRHAKDSQRMYNYWATSETETIALAPKAPFIVAEGQLSGFEKDWKTANSKSHAFLQYNPKSVAGQLIGPPQRNGYEAPVQAITMARMNAAEDMKATTGIYDASLGNRGNETSGVAIQRRNIQAQTSNFHFTDNLNKSIRHAGRILVELIPKIYDAARAVRIIGEEDQQEIVLINQFYEKHGRQVKHDLSEGKYDVTINSGPSFQTKRQEAVAAMLDLTKALPQSASVIADIMVKNMDIPGSEEMSKRLKSILPPGIAQDDDKNKMPIPPQVQAQMQQYGQMIDQLTAQLNEANKKIENKTIEIESRERIENQKLEVQILLKQAEMQGGMAMATLQAELAAINKRLMMLDINQPIDGETGGMMANPQQIPQVQNAGNQMQAMNEQNPTDGMSG